MSKRFRHGDDLVCREILGETLLVPVRGNLADLHQVYLLNAVGGHVWQQINGQRDLPAIRDSIVAKFVVGAAQADADLGEFIDRLQVVGLITEVA